VDVEPALLAWARGRSGLDDGYLEGRFPKLGAWETRQIKPTLKQLESFAAATHTPFGLLLLTEPPDEDLPLPDFRTMRNRAVGMPTADLLDTIYLCQQRQEWYRDFKRLTGEEPLDWVGSMTTLTPVVEAAASIRERLQFGLEDRLSYRTWMDSLRELAEHAEELGVLVMISGIVASNTHRVLDSEDFRGFAIVDDLAPVVFVNGADTKAAQIFTLAHELAHLWLGASALSNASPAVVPDNEIERWCNSVAAELLVPIDDFQSEFSLDRNLTEELDRLARRYKVSTLVVLGRARDLGALSVTKFRQAFSIELERVLALRGNGGTGGNFYNTLPVRASKRFTRSVVASTLEGRTLYRDAARLLGFKKLKTLDQLGKTLGIA
jgi:Zn-dependent peptidase ImmA (M78 family)